MILNIDGHSIHINDGDCESLREYKIMVLSGDRPYVVGTKNGKMYRIARVISECPDGFVVTFIDSDTLNLVRSNLLVCTKPEASKLSSRAKDPNRVFGIEVLPSGKYRARPSFQSVRYNLGTFETLYSAEIAVHNFLRDSNFKIKKGRERAKFRAALKKADEAKVSISGHESP